MEAGQTADHHRTPRMVAHLSNVFHKIHERSDHLPEYGLRRVEALVLRHGAPAAKVRLSTSGYLLNSRLTPISLSCPRMQIELTSRLYKGKVHGLARKKGVKAFWKTGFEVDESVLAHPRFQPNYSLPGPSKKKTKKRDDADGTKLAFDTGSNNGCNAM